MLLKYDLIKQDFVDILLKDQAAGLVMKITHGTYSPCWCVHMTTFRQKVVRKVGFCTTNKAGWVPTAVTFFK